MRAAWLIFVIGCGGSSSITSTDGQPGDDTPPADDAPPAIVDNDQDGLDDALEQQLAEQYLPYVSLAPDDGCPLDGFLVRVRPHPADAT